MESFSSQLEDLLKKLLFHSLGHESRKRLFELIIKEKQP
jgi:hypothetical protein